MARRKRRPKQKQAPEETPVASSTAKKPKRKRKRGKTTNEGNSNGVGALFTMDTTPSKPSSSGLVYDVPTHSTTVMGDAVSQADPSKATSGASNGNNASDGRGPDGNPSVDHDSDSHDDQLEEPGQTPHKDPPSFPKSPYAVDPDVYTTEDAVHSAGRSIRDLLDKQRQDGDDAGEEQHHDSLDDFVAVTPIQSNKREPTDQSDSTKKNLAAELSEASSDSKLPPWMDTSKFWSRTSPEMQLHNEIVRFTELLSPTDAETEERQQIVDEITKVVDDLFDDATVEVFGSFSTGLCLPDSDVDIVIFGAGKGGIYKLACELRERGMVDYMNVIDKARVPIIKLRIKGHSTTADICFDQTGGPEAGSMIRQLLERTPEVRHLTLTVKYFLAQRSLNETFKGGVGSYLCFLMVVSCVQHYRKERRRSFERRKEIIRDLRWDKELEQEHNLGTLLLEFFDLFGRRLRVGEVTISLMNGGCFKKKNWTGNERDRNLLSIENPLDNKLNVGSSSWAFYSVRNSFSHARNILRSTCATYPRGQSSILLTVIAVDDNLVRRRQNLDRQRAG